MKETNVIRTSVMGKNPHTVYSVSVHDIMGNVLCLGITEPSLDALTAGLGGNFILQPEIEETVANLESAGQTEFTEAEKLSFAKDMVTRAITAYDESPDVNGFVLRAGGKEYDYWLDAETRNHLVTSVTSWSETHDEYTLDMRERNASVSIPCNRLLQMLSELENYAVACYNTTSAHLLAVAGMESVSGAVEYDYTAGYPGKITFKV